MNCPIRQDIDRSLRSGRTLLKEMRRLRRSLKTCEACEEEPECLQLQSIADRLNEMVTEINAEWETAQGPLTGPEGGEL